MIYPKDKLEITKLVLAELPAGVLSYEDTLDKVIFKWWATGRSSTGLRLTYEGANAFAHAKITNYDFCIDIEELLSSSLFSSWMQFVLYTTKTIQCPHWIGTDDILRLTKYKKIDVKIYDHAIATLITLHGDMVSYLHSIERTKKFEQTKYTK